MKNIDEVLMFKIITLGEGGVGKTSFIKRYVHNTFDLNCSSTIGQSILFQEFEKDGKTIQLKFIDTVGQEKHKALSKTYYRNADGVLFVFSLDDQNSFDQIQIWMSFFTQNKQNYENIPIYLIGNKCDLIQVVNEESIENLKNRFNIKKYFKTSAKDNINIKETIEDLFNELYKIYTGNKEKKISQNTKILLKYDGPRYNNCCPLKWEKKIQ